MINYLSWDSNFFNISIYELKTQNIGEEGSILEMDLAALNFGDIVQCKLDTTNVRLLEKLILYGFFNEGKVVLYRKIIDKHAPRCKNIQIETAKKHDKDMLLKIAQGAFINSRFKDHYFGLNAADKLYTYWVSAAILGKYDDCCILHRDKNGSIVGFVTVKKTIECVKIGLLAVNAKFQQQGVGGQLMKLVEAYAIENNIATIEVATQYDNISAKRLYQAKCYIEMATFNWLYFKK